MKAHERSKPGTVPAGIVIWANENGKKVEKVPYPRKVIALLASAKQMWERGRADYSWSKPHRRQQPKLPIRPGMVKPVPKIGVVVDTSGSMGNLGPWAKGILQTIEKRHPNVVVVDCDTEAYSNKKKRGRKREHRGGGGTALASGFYKLIEQKVDWIVVITDGESPWPEEIKRPPVDIIVPKGAPATPKWARRSVVADN